MKKKLTISSVFFSLIPIVIIGLVIVLLNQLTPKEPEAPQSTVNQDLNQVTILLAKPINAIYPQKNDDPTQDEFSQNIFSGLVSFRSGKIEPALALSWKNNDPNNWTLNLRPGVKFSDGRALTPDDVKFSIEEAIKNNWPIDAPLFNIDNVSSVNNQTIAIRTKIPIPNLIILLKSVPILSKDQFSAIKVGESPIGTGPYKLVSNNLQKESGVVVEQTLTLEANQNYFGNKPKVKQLQYKYLTDSKKSLLTKEQVQNSYSAIESGAISKNLASELLTGNFSKLMLSKPSFAALFMNFNDKHNRFPNQKNPLSIKNVRRAVNLALDPRSIMNEATISGKITGQLSSSAAFGFDPGIRRVNTSDGDARKLLKEVGFEKGFAFTLDLDENQLQLGKLIAKQLKTIGITVTLQPNNPDAQFKKVTSGDFTIFLGNWLNDFYDTSTTFTNGIATAGKENYGGYTNSDIDKKVTELNNNFNPDSRERIQQQLMSLAVNEFAWIPLWEDTNDWLVTDTLDATPASSFPLGVDISGK